MLKSQCVCLEKQPKNPEIKRMALVGTCGYPQRAELKQLTIHFDGMGFYGKLEMPQAYSSFWATVNALKDYARSMLSKILLSLNFAIILFLQNQTSQRKLRTASTSLPSAFEERKMTEIKRSSQDLIAVLIIYRRQVLHTGLFFIANFFNHFLT